MPSEKSEAQLKNEAEVKRILKERGYSKQSNKKQVAKSLGHSISPHPIHCRLIDNRFSSWWRLVFYKQTIRRKTKQ